MFKFQLWIGSLLLFACIVMMYVIEWSFRISELHGGGYGVLLFLLASVALIWIIHMTNVYIEVISGVVEGRYAIVALESREDDYDSGYGDE